MNFGIGAGAGVVVDFVVFLLVLVVGGKTHGVACTVAEGCVLFIVMKRCVRERCCRYRDLFGIGRVTDDKYVGFVEPLGWEVGFVLCLAIDIDLLPVFGIAGFGIVVARLSFFLAIFVAFDWRSTPG